MLSISYAGKLCRKDIFAHLYFRLLIMSVTEDFDSISTESESIHAQHTHSEFLKRWGPYVSNRQWGTVREMYNLGPKNEVKFSDEAWGNLSFEESCSTAYQFGEDGIFGISDENQYLCFSLAFWNCKDKHIKERFFGLPGIFGDPAGNLGEDVKELFYYLDNTPDHSYMRALYKYPCEEFPYQQIKHGNFLHEKLLEEYELLDTGILLNDNFFDIFVEYAKDEDSGSIYVWIHIQNRSANACELMVLPTLWFRNVWEWGQKTKKPKLSRADGANPGESIPRAQIKAEYLHDIANYPKPFYLWGASVDHQCPEVVFTENQTDPRVRQQLKSDGQMCKHIQLQSLNELDPDSSGLQSLGSLSHKDSIASYLKGDESAVDVSAHGQGTKSAMIFKKTLAANRKNGEGVTDPESRWDLCLRLYIDDGKSINDSQFNTVDHCKYVIEKKRKAAESSYGYPSRLAQDSGDGLIYRQALATLLWNKQFYHFNISKWMFYRELFVSQLEADATPIHGHLAKNEVKAEIKKNLNSDWQHIATGKIMVMPDKWEYPYFCTWDSAFHAVTMSLVDVVTAQELLKQLVEADCMHRNGQMPGCEFEFSDVHPPIHAWAVLKVYDATIKQQSESAGLQFLEEMVWKLWRNFSWWTTHQRVERRFVNSDTNKEEDDKDHPYYRGGFLGLDNITVVDRNHFTGERVYIEQVDGAAWVALFALNLLEILVKLSGESEGNESYRQMADHCLGTFLSIEKTLNEISSRHFVPSWDMKDYWYYDILRIDLEHFKMDLPLRVRSLVGMIPLLATAVIRGPKQNRIIQLIADRYKEEKNKSSTMDHFYDRADSAEHHWDPDEVAFEFAIVNEKKFAVMLDRILSESEFLSDFGIRSLSKYHHDHPFSLDGLLENKYGTTLPIHVGYEPGRSLTQVFGSKNSNWRGPIWVQMNYMFIDMLRKRQEFSREVTVKRPVPTFAEGQKERLTYMDIANNISDRIIGLFRMGYNSFRPCHAQNDQAIQFYRKRDSNPAVDSVNSEVESDLVLFYEFFHGEHGAGLGASHQSWTTIVANLIAERYQT